MPTVLVHEHLYFFLLEESFIFLFLKRPEKLQLFTVKYALLLISTVTK